jgi:exopolysaccharide biosynthesis protein
MLPRSVKRFLLIAMHLLVPAAIFYVVLGTCRSASRAGFWTVKSDSGWGELEKGLGFREVRLSYRRGAEGKVTAYDMQVTAVRFDPLRFGMTAAFNPVKEGRRLADLAEKHDAVVISNGGYFGHKNEPVTLVLSGGKVLREFWRELPDSGVFALAADGRAAVRVPKEVKPPYEGLDFAVQNSPLLVRGGRLHFRPRVARKPEEPASIGHRRTAIGVDRSGRVVLLVCDAPIGLVEMGRLLAAPEERAGFGLVSAVNLDGGPSSGMMIRHQKLKKRVAAGRTIPYVIFVRRRPKPLPPPDELKPDKPMGQFVPVRPKTEAEP